MSEIKSGRPDPFPLTWEEAGCPPALKAKEWERFFHTRSRPRHPHAVAAIALHERDFGFTREDVKVIREAATEAIWAPAAEEQLTSLADRIEALLPPEES